MKMALLIYRILAVALLAAFAYAAPIMIVIYMLWGMLILIGWIGYHDEVPGWYGSPRYLYEYAAFFWNWEFPPYRPKGHL